MLPIVAKADVCWNTDTKEYTNYLWLEDEMVTDYQNAVDDRLVAMFVYEAQGVSVDFESKKIYKSWYCEYTKQYKGRGK